MLALEMGGNNPMVISENFGDLMQRFTPLFNLHLSVLVNVVLVRVVHTFLWVRKVMNWLLAW